MKFQNGDKILINRYRTNANNRFIFFAETNGAESEIISDDGLEVRVDLSITLYDESMQHIARRQVIQDHVIDLDLYSAQDEPQLERPETLVKLPSCCKGPRGSNPVIFRLVEGPPWSSVIEYPGCWHCTNCGYTYYSSAVRSIPEEIYNKVERGEVTSNGDEQRLSDWMDEHL